MRPDADEPTTTSGATVPAEPSSRTMGLPQATSLVVGTIIGVGIFNVPASLASYGPISLVAMALTTVGALCLALLFASLSRRMPADGGPYAYARAAFGNAVGFSNAWLYWIPAWAGNAAIATGWVLYVERFVNTGHGTVGTVLLTLASIWAAAAINRRGIRSMGQIQLWTSVIKFLPLLAMSTIGLFFIDLDNFTPFNLSGQAALPAIGSAMALCLFSYIGVESASVAAAKVADPTRNVPRATILGTLASASVYLLSLGAIFGILPNAAAAETISGTSWVGALVAFLVVVSGFGALNGWTMLAAEVPYAASKDGLFPQRFEQVSKRGVPAFGILVSATLSTICVLLSHVGETGITVFNTLVLMTGIAAAIPYAFSALAQIKWRVADKRVITRGRLVRDLVVAGVSFVVSVLFIVYSANTDADGFAVYYPFLYALGAFLLGVPVYLMNRKRMTPPTGPPPPVDTIEAVDTAPASAPLTP